VREVVAQDLELGVKYGPQVVVEQPDLEQARVDASLHRVQVGLGRSRLVDEQHSDRDRKRHDDQPDERVQGMERMESRVEHGSQQGVQRRHRVLSFLGDVAEATEPLLDLLLGVGALELGQLLLEGVADELLGRGVAGDLRVALHLVDQLAVELDLRGSEHGVDSLRQCAAGFPAAAPCGPGKSSMPNSARIAAARSLSSCAWRLSGRLVSSTPGTLSWSIQWSPLHISVLSVKTSRPTLPSADWFEPRVPFAYPTTMSGPISS